MTSGYDGSVLNGLQAVQPWEDCKHIAVKQRPPSLTCFQTLAAQPEPCLVS
jgi:hypothetical protein